MFKYISKNPRVKQLSGRKYLLEWRVARGAVFNYLARKRGLPCACQKYVYFGTSPHTIHERSAGSFVLPLSRRCTPTIAADEDMRGHHERIGKLANPLADIVTYYQRAYLDGGLVLNDLYQQETKVKISKRLHAIHARLGIDLTQKDMEELRSFIIMQIKSYIISYDNGTLPVVGRPRTKKKGATVMHGSLALIIKEIPKRLAAVGMRIKPRNFAFFIAAVRAFIALTAKDKMDLWVFLEKATRYLFDAMAQLQTLMCTTPQKLCKLSSFIKRIDKSIDVRATNFVENYLFHGPPG